MVPLQLLMGAIIPQASWDCGCIASISPCHSKHRLLTSSRREPVRNSDPQAPAAYQGLQMISGSVNQRSATSSNILGQNRQGPRYGRCPWEHCHTARRYGSQALHSVAMLRHAFEAGKCTSSSLMSTHWPAVNSVN